MQVLEMVFCKSIFAQPDFFGQKVKNYFLQV